VKPEAERWVQRAEADLEMCDVALELGSREICLFHCHEAVEKILKAIWLEQRGEQAEKTHSLPYLARELSLNLSDEQRDFLRKLYLQLIPSRYPEDPPPDEETVRWYHREAKEFSWLRQVLK